MGRFPRALQNCDMAEGEDSAWTVSLRKHHVHLRSSIIMASILPTIRPLLTLNEYSCVAGKDSIVDRVDELVEILLTKDISTFERFCSALETHGYHRLASKLRGEGNVIQAWLRDS